MAITESSNYVIIPIQEHWGHFSIKYEGKVIMIYGYDGTVKTIFSDDYEEVFLTCIEQHWSDLAQWEILGEATDDKGKRYLLLKRMP